MKSLYIRVTAQRARAHGRRTRQLAPRARLVALLAFPVPLLGACDALILDREPEIAHLEIDSSDVSEVVLVTSKWFLDVPDPDCEGAGCQAIIQLVESDTTTVPLPFSASYPFDFRLEFYAETYPVTPVRATLSMKVHLDDEEWYNDSRLLVPQDSEGERETLRFVYRYNYAALPGG